VRYFIRWWETLGRAERIVALSIGLSAPIAIINSTVWAIAVTYITHERTRVALERLRLQADHLPALTDEDVTTAGRPAGTRHLADRRAPASLID
jgi:hypothetical protein